LGCVYLADFPTTEKPAEIKDNGITAWVNGSANPGKKGGGEEV